MDDADGRGMCCPGVPEKPEGEDLVCRWEVGWIWEHKWSTREKGECACVDADDRKVCVVVEASGRPFLPASVFLKVIR